MIAVPPFRNTEAVIDLDAIRSNFELACRLAPDSRSIAVIKADAYGHGAVSVAMALRDVTAMFAVGFIDEAIALRDAGITEPLLLLEGANSFAELEYASAEDLAVVVHTETQLALLEDASLAVPLHVWLKVDTGMHRLGIRPDAVTDAEERLSNSGNCLDEWIVCTHLACSDDPADPMTERQIRLFEKAVQHSRMPQSIANTGGILAHPASHKHWNRPGYMLYGGSPFAHHLPPTRELRPAMTLKSSVIALRDVKAGETVGYGGRWHAETDSRIATVAIGYADGYPRHAPSGTPVKVAGTIAPLAGTVSMDMIGVDVTDIGDVSVGDEVVLWGDGLSVDTVARAAGTIGYELLTAVSARVPRRYVAGQAGKTKGGQA